jgi:ABC-2 type transport system permease protein
MPDALSAELLKLRRHKATWFLVWLYPILFTILFLLTIAVGMAGLEPPDHQALPSWLAQTAIPWRIPGNGLGRYMMAAFIAVVFAGEYGWNTWKLIVPHRSRNALIAAKYGAVLLLFAAAFVLSALISLAGTWADDVLTGDVIPGGITAGGLLRVHGEAALAAFAPFLVTLGYASLASVLTRSTLAGLVIALVAVTAEQLVFAFGPALAMKAPAIAWALYHALPGYHVDNLASWIQHAAPLQTPFPTGSTVALSWPVSLAAVLAWLLLLIGGTFAAFRRQDIN